MNEQLTQRFTKLKPYLTHFDHSNWLGQSGQIGIDGRVLPKFLVDTIEVEVGDVDGKVVITNVLQHELEAALGNYRCVEMLKWFSPHLSSMFKISIRDTTDVVSDDTTMYVVEHIESGTIIGGSDPFEQADELIEFLVRNYQIDLAVIMLEWFRSHSSRSVYIPVDVTHLMNTIADWIAEQLPVEEEPNSCA